MIDFEEKRGRGEFEFWNTSEDITDLLTTSYDEPTGAMRQLTQHLLPQIQPAQKTEPTPAEPDVMSTPVSQVLAQNPPTTDSTLTPVDGDDQAQSSSTPVAPVPEVSSAPAAPMYDWSNVDFDVVEEASKAPLDGAIAAAIAMAGTDNKIKAASMSILLIGGTSALKGLGAFVSER
jgi:actin-related protein 8